MKESDLTLESLCWYLGCSLLPLESSVTRFLRGFGTAKVALLL